VTIHGPGVPITSNGLTRDHCTDGARIADYLLVADRLTINLPIDNPVNQALIG
jgi:hypothetical protein